MKAFHGDIAVKEKYLARLKAHHEADKIIQGTGWDGERGCAVGCTLNKYSHEAYETELGLPSWLAHLEDRIFEGLPVKEAKRFAVDFLKAVPTGADVSKVRWQLASKRHTRDRDRIAQNPASYAQKVAGALNLVIAYCDAKEKTESAESSAVSAARSAAAAESAAWSARSAWSAWSAESSAAAWSAAAAAESAAWSAWSSAAAESAAWSASAAARSAAAAAESAAWSASAESSESAAWSSAAAVSAASWSARSAAWSASESSESAAWSSESAAWSSAAARSAAAAARRSAHFKWESETLLELLRAAPVGAE